MGTRVQVLAFVLMAAPVLGPTTSSAQTAAAEASYEVPRTPWGHPDLEGVWDYRTITPLERRPELGDRAFYTDEEIAELEARAARRMDEPPDEDTPANLVHAQYMTDPGRYVDESRRTSLIIDPPNGRLPPLTPEAAQRQAEARAAAAPGGRADSYLDRTLMERCISRGMPSSILPGLYNNNIRITQGPGYVAIVHEMIHETRIVPLDGRPYTGVPSYMGESRGYWDGDTLVVETQSFNGVATYRGSGRNMRLTERYTRVGPDAIDFTLTVEDPTVWVQPWTAAYRMRTAEGELYEYACHEGNYGLRNILENARYEERQAAENAAKQENAE